MNSTLLSKFVTCKERTWQFTSELSHNISELKVGVTSSLFHSSLSESYCKWLQISTLLHETDMKWLDSPTQKQDSIHTAR